MLNGGNLDFWTPQEPNIEEFYWSLRKGIFLANIISTQQRTPLATVIEKKNKLVSQKHLVEALEI